MSVRTKIEEANGVFFITFTCARWLPLFKITDGYGAVYKWFDYLKQEGHYIIAYVIMPNHIHALIAFRNSESSINLIVGNGKRFMAYDLVKRLKEQGKEEMLNQLASWVNKTERLINKKHQVFEPSSDKKECRSIKFIKQKSDYIHLNPCKAGFVTIPEDYLHSSARYYYTGSQGIYHVITVSSPKIRYIQKYKILHFQFL
jgi:REP element-mobilizing transposase RayT